MTEKCRLHTAMTADRILQLEFGQHSVGIHYKQLTRQNCMACGEATATAQQV